MELFDALLFSLLMGAGRHNLTSLPKLEPMLAAIESGDLPAEITSALTCNGRRPVIETSICIGFTDGRQFEILARPPPSKRSKLQKSHALDFNGSSPPRLKPFFLSTQLCFPECNKTRDQDKKNGHKSHV